MSPSGSKLLKGALVRLDPTNPASKPELLIFQFNPATMRRTIVPRKVGGEPGGHSESVRFVGAPQETISLDVEIDALEPIDPRPQGQKIAAQKGIYPWLYAIETLMYPQTAQVQANTSLLAQGMLEVAPYQAPITLLVWGPNRVVPVTLERYTVTEQTFDNDLNPIRATIALEARALSYSDLNAGAPGFSQFMAYAQMKEQLAKLGVTTNAGATGVKSSSL